MGKALTKAQKRALEWLAANGPVGAIPIAVTNLAMIRKLIVLGYAEESGREPGLMGFIKYRVSDAGRQVLSTHGEPRDG